MFDEKSSAEQHPGDATLEQRWSEDPRFCEALAACDEALACGQPPMHELAAASHLSPDSAEALEQAGDCLQLMHRVIEADLLRPEDVLDAAATEIDPETELWLQGDARRLGPDAQTPRTVGRFQLLELLGAGGFGIVYRAWDPITQRDVALKIPRIEALASTELQQRFEQEARAAAKLDHPNIVSVYEAGRERSLPYIVSQYHQGVTLSHWLKGPAGRARIAPRDAAEAIAALADAVAHAHQRGVLHRDIKPSNILLVHRPSASNSGDALRDSMPMLMDFGLAKLSSTADDMTRTGALLGTLHYMSPEQAAGRTKQIGPASDVYSLGAVLYELLAGQPPFHAESDLAVLQQIQATEPTSLRQVRSIPVDLETICLKCLEKVPGKRYASASALADDLRRYLRGMPILARRATALQRVEKWARRNPHWALFAMSAACALVIFVTFLTVSNRRLTTALSLVEAQRRLADERAEDIRGYAYGVDMKLAQEAWENSNPTLAESYLDKYLPEPGQRDLRRFEWHYLKDSIRDGSEVVARQAAPVWSMAVSPDERRLATADRSGVVRLWSLETKSLQRELRGHEPGDIDGLAFTKDGNRLISAGNDHSIRLWDVETGEAIAVLDEHHDWIGGLALSPDGSLFATGDADGRVLLWNMTAAELPRELYRHPGPVRWIVFHPHRSIVVSGCEQGEVRIWDYVANRPPAEAPKGLLEAPPDPSWRNAVFMADGLQLWAPNRARLLRWDFGPRDNWTVLGRDFGTDYKVMAVAAIGLGDLMLTAHDEQFEIALRRAADPATAVKHFRGHDDSVRTIVSIDAGNAFLTGSEDGTVRRWRLSSSSRYAQVIDLPTDALTFAWAPNHNALAVGLVDSRLGVVPEAGRQFVQCALLDGPIQRLLWSPDGKRLCGITDQGVVSWVDVETHQLLATFAVDQPTMDCAVDPSGVELAIACKDHRLSVHEALTGRQLWSFEKPGQSVSGVRYLNDRELIAWFSDGDVECFDNASGRLIRSLTTHRREVTSIALSADGRILATSARDKAIRFFSTDNFNEIRQFTLSDEVHHVHFFDNDTRLLASVDGDFVVLDTKTGQTLLRLPQSIHRSVICTNHDRTKFAGRVKHGLLIHSLIGAAEPPTAGPDTSLR